jgi:hypothetical protein
MAPPGTEKISPAWRSRKSRIMVTTIRGNAVSTMKQVMTSLQVKSGIRSIVIPGARRRTTVARRLRASSSTPRFASPTPMIQKSAPVPGVESVSESGK